MLEQMTGKYDCAFTQKLQKHVMNILCASHKEHEKEKSDTRVILVQLWSDDFEAPKIKA